MSRWIDTEKELPPLDTWVQVVWGAFFGLRIGGPPAAMLRRSQIDGHLVWWHYSGDLPVTAHKGSVVRMWRRLHPEPAEGQTEQDDLPQPLDGE
jgi:hypothetical protein